MVSTIAASLGMPAPYLAGSTLLAPVTGGQCLIGRGWPTTKQLADALAAGVTIISVFPARHVRRVTRYFYRWQDGPTVIPTLTVSVSSNLVTFAGSGGAGQVAGIRFGSPNSGAAFAYRLVPGDTPVSVAAALAALIPGASATGAIVSSPTIIGLAARVAADQPVWLETRRQQQQVTLTCWCPSVDIRDATAKAVDGGFAFLQNPSGDPTEFIGLADGSAAWVRYVDSYTDDAPQQARLWRRDLRYLVEFPTTLLQQQPEVLFGGGVMSIDGGTLEQYGDLQPPSEIETDPSGDVWIDDNGNVIGVPPQ